MSLYQIISTGIAPGHDEVNVLHQLAKLFKTTKEQVSPLLSQHKVLKTLNEKQSAKRYHAALKKAGLNCYIHKLEDTFPEDGLDSSWEILAECSACGFYQPLIHQCQNCGHILFELEALGTLSTEWESLVVCEQCGFMQPPSEKCHNCGNMF